MMDAAGSSKMPLLREILQNISIYLSTDMGSDLRKLSSSLYLI
jgi:hypothetical protein